HLRNDLKQSGVHQSRIAVNGFMSPVARLPGGEVLETMKGHQVTKRRMARALRVNPIQRGQGGLDKLFPVNQHCPLCSSCISVPRKEQGCKALAVATGYPGERRQRVKDGNALNGLRPEQECFTRSVGENAVEHGEHFLRGRTYVTTLAGFIATAQADTVS